MIDRRDISGLTVAILAHAGLLAAIYYWPWHEKEPPAAPPEPIQVTLADDIGLVSAAPDPSDEPPAQAAQGDDAPDDSDAAPPETPPEPDKSKPTPPRTNPDAAKQPNPPPKQNQQQGSNAGRRRPGLDLDENSFTNGPAREKTEGTGQKSQATMTGQALTNITTAILRQVKPCADRQNLPPGPEVRQIVAVVQLRLSPDGSLAGPVKILRHEGVDDGNQRYVERVDDAVQSIFAGCTPIRDLPPELYDVPKGWRQITFRYHL